MINVLIWLATEVAGGSTDTDVLLRFGAMYGPYIADGDYWRLFTAMFLHVGLTHLAFNGFGLFIFGQQVEKFYGPYRFGVIYILAGLAGSVASFALNDTAVGAGASGAIFGILGALVAFFVIHRDKLGELGRQSLTGFLILAGINLFIGFSIPNVDNFAHMGGFAAGFALTLPLAPKYRPVYDNWGQLGGLQDTNSILKQWWVIPVALIVLALATMLGAGSIGENIFTHVRQAERYLDDGEHELALDEIAKAIQMEPRLAESYLVSAKIYADLGNYRTALTEAGLAFRLGLNDDGQAEAVALMREARALIQ